MYIHKTMINEIAKAFYDKEVEILDKSTITDAEGGVISKGYEVIDSFMGNVSFSNCKAIQEEYGLEYQIDISITTLPTTEIEMDNIIKYDNVIFKVTDVLKSDSHKLVVAIKWQQQ